MTRIFLVRHGQSIWHTDNRYCGVSDVELSPHGHEQAGRLAAWATKQRIDAICVSPLKRALDTADPAARALSLTVHVEPRLVELDFGRCEGLTTSEMAKAFPESWAAFENDPVRHHLPGGEDPHHLVNRAAKAFIDFAAVYPSGRVMVVAHSTLIRLMLCHWLGIPLANYRRMFPALDNVAVTEFDLDAKSFALRRFNLPLAVA
jgi:probable phosphoglycerate mutase